MRKRVLTDEQKKRKRENERINRAKETPEQTARRMKSSKDARDRRLKYNPEAYMKYCEANRQRDTRPDVKHRHAQRMIEKYRSDPEYAAKMRKKNNERKEIKRIERQYDAFIIRLEEEGLCCSTTRIVASYAEDDPTISP